MPDKIFNRSILKLVFIMISEFLIKWVISHIVHDIRVDLEATHHNRFLARS